MQALRRSYAEVFDAVRTRDEHLAILEDQSGALIRGSYKAIARSQELLNRTKEKAIRVVLMP